MSSSPVEREPKENSQDGDADLYIDPVAEKKLLRKLDWNIAPVLMILFLISYLDRSNIGNAAIAGMTQDLHLVGNQLGSMFRFGNAWVYETLTLQTRSHSSMLPTCLSNFLAR